MLEAIGLASMIIEETDCQHTKLHVPSMPTPQEFKQNVGRLRVAIKFKIF